MESEVNSRQQDDGNGIFTKIRLWKLGLVIAVFSLGLRFGVRFIIDRTGMYELGGLASTLVALFTYLGIFAVIIMALRRQGASPTDVFLKGRDDSAFSLKAIPKIVIIMMLFSMISASLWLWLTSLVAPGWAETFNAGDMLTGTRGPFFALETILRIVLIVIVAPIVEELLFRGVLLNRVRAVFGLLPAIIGPCILFGILHFNVIGIGAFGLVLALLYLRTRTLLVPILCHMMNNLVAVLLSLPILLSEPDVVEAAASAAPAAGFNWIQIFLFILFGMLAAQQMEKYWPAREEFSHAAKAPPEPDVSPEVPAPGGDDPSAMGG